MFSPGQLAMVAQVKWHLHVWSKQTLFPPTVSRGHTIAIRIAVTKLFNSTAGPSSPGTVWRTGLCANHCKQIAEPGWGSRTWSALPPVAVHLGIAPRWVTISVWMNCRQYCCYGSLIHWHFGVYTYSHVFEFWDFLDPAIAQRVGDNKMCDTPAMTNGFCRVWWVSSIDEGGCFVMYRL